jgi:hypothetical protein
MTSRVPFSEEHQQRLFSHCRGFHSAIAQWFEPFGANSRKFGLGGLQISAECGIGMQASKQCLLS